MKLTPLIRLFAVIFVLGFLSVTASAQTKEDKILAIRTAFQSINTNKGLKKLKLNNEDISSHALDNGLSLTAFYQDNDIVKIQVSVGLSFAIREYEYYFKKGQPLFVFEKENAFRYNAQTGALDPTKTRTTFEARYYLYNKTLINVKSKGAKRMENVSVMTNIELLSKANEYLAVVKRRLKIGK